MSALPEVLHVIHSGAIGGGPQVVLDLVERVPARHTVAAADDGPLLADAEARGAETEAIRRAGEFSFALSLPHLARLAQRADLVHLHGQFAGFYGSISGAMARKPIVYTAHFPSFVTDRSLKTRVRNFTAEAVPCRLASAVIACAETSRKLYLERGLVPANRIRTIYNGVARPVSNRNPAALRAALRVDSGPLILAVGRMTPQKGFDLVVDAMPHVLHAAPEAKLLLVGDGECRPALEKQVAYLGLNGAVRFTGFRRDTGDLYALSTVVAVPSRYDVFPLVPLEAMMAGKPVVAADLPVFHEAIDESYGALSNRDPRRFATDLLRFLCRPREAAAAGARAAERARRDFSVDRMAQEYDALYHDILRDPK